jgi:hypothetical protein
VVGEVQAARRGEQFGSKTGQSLISPRRLETSARKPPLLQGVRCGYRGRTGRPTVGRAIGRRRADRSGSGVAPAWIGRAAGIWDRDSLLAGVALWLVARREGTE